MATIKINSATIGTSIFAVVATAFLGIQIATGLVAPIL
ncbi:MAG: hypothetical protein ACI915_001313 [Gammaproteobacteria bacterium]|jgi:hypothetical protein